MKNIIFLYLCICFSSPDYNTGSYGEPVNYWYFEFVRSG